MIQLTKANIQLHTRATNKEDAIRQAGVRAQEPARNRFKNTRFRTFTQRGSTLAQGAGSIEESIEMPSVASMLYQAPEVRDSAAAAEVASDIYSLGGILCFLLTAKPPADGASERQAFADDVRYYLSLRPRQLPSRYFYDAVGSALFEAICRLPWYPVTRAETRLIECHARRIVGHLDPLSTVIELGPGSGEKLALLVESGRTRPVPR
jgi:serine/threonine protein kinase